MQTHWMRYVWILVVLFVLAIIAVLLSMSIPRAGNKSGALAQAQQAFDANDLDGALAAAESALSSNPNDIAALLAKGSSLAQKGSLEFKESEYGPQAIAVAQRVLVLDPNSVEAWRLIGYANEIMQNYSATHEAYAKAMALDPENALTVSQEAHAYDLQGDMDKAEAGYRRALSLNQNIASAKLGLARVLMYRGKPDEALPLYESVADTPGNARQRAEAAYSAGQVNEAIGQYAAAEARFRSSTTLDASYALGWTGLATELFRQAIEKDSNFSTDKRNALMTDSVAYLEKATTINPNQSLAHYQLALEMLTMGRSSDALIILEGLQKQIIQNDITLSSVAKTAMQQKVQTAINTIRAGKSAKNI